MYGRMIAQAREPPRGRCAMLVFDHCHRHGWVRGLICLACNNPLITLENQGCSAHRGADPAALETYLGTAPGCLPGARDDRAAPARYSDA
jgi:Recombination endonuclease VII